MTTTRIILFIIITVIVASVILAKAGMDYHQIKLRDQESVKSQFWIHLFGAYLIALPLYLLSIIVTISVGWNQFTWFLAFLGIYFLIFDYTLNIIRNKPLLYIGKTDVVDQTFQWIARRTSIPVEQVALLLKVLTLSIIFCL